jgi:hypothetical protein
MTTIPANAQRIDGTPRFQTNERTSDDAPGRLGRLPVRSDTRALLFDDFITAPATLPKATNFWRRRSGFPLRTFGNDKYGDCTRAKQAVAHMRIERLETRRTPEITDDEVVRVYVDMSNRLYGGGDNGAFETDALSEWRNPDLTFRDTKGRPLTIDAFLRLNPFNHDQLRAALVVAGPKGFPFCINLPYAFQSILPPADWDIPSDPGFQPIGAWMPGSWGGHSMWAFDYDEVGLWYDHTWALKPQRITWRAAAIYIDEAHSVIDSIDTWRKQRSLPSKTLKAIAGAVNDVSVIKVAA